MAQPSTRTDEAYHPLVGTDLDSYDSSSSAREEAREEGSGRHGGGGGEASPEEMEMTASQAWCLGIAETVCVLLFSSALGRWVDCNPRLYTVLLTIIVNRAVIVLSCLLWYFILTSNIPSRKNALFAIVLIFGMIEKNARMTNILSMERGWVPTLASSTPDAPFNLTHLNIIMRRIDVFCKFIAPLAISTFISTVAPVKVAVVAVALTSMLSFGPEYWCVLKVWRRSSSRLRTPQEKNGEADDEPSHRHTWYGRLAVKVRTGLDAHARGLRYYFQSPVWIPSLGIAILHASVLTYSATLITYLLNVGLPLGTLTVAKATGSVFEIGSTFIFPWAVRVLSSETKDVKNELYPMEEFRDPDPETRYGLLKSETEEDVRETEDEDPKWASAAAVAVAACDPNSGVVRVGLWGICGLFLNLVPMPGPPPRKGLNRAEAEPAKIPATISLFYIDSNLPHPLSPLSSFSTTNTLPVILLITFLSISFLGRWTYDLSVTQLTQTLIPASHRSSFGGTEMAIVSGVSLGHWVAAAVWHAQTDFKWLALGSLVAVGLGAGAYARWVKIWRREERIGRGL
ncbi:hypothetical protein MMC14_002358 [Varicellaria rhodocarpa]|nr:hypothetical protein [Varicellaria rhodocarpa]